MGWRRTAAGQHWPAAAVMACALAACGGRQAIDATAADPQGPKRCLLLTTNDSEAHFDGPKAPTPTGDGSLGSIARVAAHKQAKLSERPGGVLLLEGGDVLQGRFMERADGNRAEAARLAWQIYDAAGYDYGTLGNHEFDAGPQVVRDALKGLKRYRILTANLEADGTSLDPREPGWPDGLYGKWAVVPCGGIRVGLFGLLTPSTRTISQIGDVRFGDDPVHDPARAAVAALRAQGAQVVVALTHLGVQDDIALAKDVSGIDAIVGGHSHTPMPKAQIVHGTWITQAGSRFAFVGELDLALAAGGQGLDAAATSWRMRPVDDRLPTDRDLEAHIAHVRTHLVPEVVVGQRKEPWDLTQPRGAYGQKAARMAMVVASKAMPQLESTAPVVGGLLNTGGFRSHTVYPAGPVTNLDLHAIHPFRNRLVVVTLTGQGLRDTLEHGCAPGSDGHGQGLVLWGLQMQCDRRKPAQTYREVDGKPVEIVRRGERLVAASVGGQPIDPARRYTIATLDYLAKGGSGYLPIKLGDRKCLDGKVFGEDPPCSSPLFSEALEGAVRQGWFDDPL
ncbi:MAG: bifunctional metallophosphatase/5'-nucleotidase [Deltaproteobacteria bacterium]|nr:bifunctional metallophosphatase/5'-nucleotidase [Deltaproteobacteria bacterium]